MDYQQTDKTSSGASGGGTIVEENELNIYAKNKEIPEQLRYVILLSLSYYPELLEVPIDFVFSRGIRNSVMLAQPRIGTMHKVRSERSYVIRMNRWLRLGGEQIKIETLPQDVLIGWIGHELGHIMDYLHRSTLDMVKFGIGYSLSRKYIMEAERAADTFAVERGLASKLIATKNFILDHAKISKKYKRKIRRLYLSPDDIMLLVEEAEATAESERS
ncbi:hypothetical protein [Telluribacter sp.]|jgi:hypothetical protein|uniref:hypothetical protein n=1 Tax=Telluribacter sp. TaxID=1978767 RepID=UPI002E11BFE3|nr:hypothetical protein [Telluribacter sp.]